MTDTPSEAPRTYRGPLSVPCSRCYSPVGKACHEDALLELRRLRPPGFHRARLTAFRAAAPMPPAGRVAALEELLP